MPFNLGTLIIIQILNYIKNLVNKKNTNKSINLKLITISIISICLITIFSFLKVCIKLIKADYIITQFIVTKKKTQDVKLNALKVILPKEVCAWSVDSIVNHVLNNLLLNAVSLYVVIVHYTYLTTV